MDIKADDEPLDDVSFVAGGSILYPAAGVPLALFITSGLVGLRPIVADDRVLGAYVFLAIAIGFGILGRVIGRHDDALWETSRVDPLTEIGNRRSFDDLMRREVDRAVETGMPLALLALDLDHLKKINDRHGHEMGDRALRLLADVLRATCRSRDLPARFGGDEFVVVMPRSTAEEAVVLGERIRAQFRLRAAGEVAGGATSVSIGAADLRHATSTDPAALFDAADRALYLAKSTGKDRVALLVAFREWTTVTAKQG